MPNPIPERTNDTATTTHDDRSSGPDGAAAGGATWNNEKPTMVLKLLAKALAGS